MTENKSRAELLIDYLAVLERLYRTAEALSVATTAYKERIKETGEAIRAELALGDENQPRAQSAPEPPLKDVDNTAILRELSARGASIIEVGTDVEGAYVGVALESGYRERIDLAQGDRVVIVRNAE